MLLSSAMLATSFGDGFRQQLGDVIDLEAAPAGFDGGFQVLPTAGAGGHDGPRPGGGGLVDSLRGRPGGEGGVALLDAAARTAAPGVFPGPVHLCQLQGGDTVKDIARRSVNAAGAPPELLGR